MATKTKETEKLQLVKLENLVPCTENDFPITEIEDLVASIKMLGLLTPLTVTPTDAEDTYEIVSGERRFTALQELVKEKEYKDTYESVPCYIMPKEAMDTFTKKLAVIAANLDVRESFNIEAYRFKVVSIVKEMLEADAITKDESLVLYENYLKTSDRYRRHYTAVFGTELQPLVENGEVLVKAASPIACIKDEDKREKMVEKVKEEVEKRKKDDNFKVVNKSDINRLLAELEEDDDQEISDEEILNSDIEEEMREKAKKKGYLTDELIDLAPRSEVTITLDKVKKLLSNLMGKTITSDDKNKLLEMQQLINNFVKEMLLN